MQSVTHVEVERGAVCTNVFERNPSCQAGESPAGWCRGTIFDDPDAKGVMIAVATVPSGEGVSYGGISARFTSVFTAIDWILTVTRGCWPGPYTVSVEL